MAVGNPFGPGHRVSVGIIGAREGFMGEGPFDDFFQTDLALSPRNAGAPLFDMKGEVVAIISDAGREELMGFAIPVDVAKDLLPQLEKGEIKRSWLGVTVQDPSPGSPDSPDHGDPEGVLVTKVMPDSPAEKAGLMKGDVIAEFDGKRVKNENALTRFVEASSPATAVTVTVIRDDGERVTIEVAMGTSPEEESHLKPRKVKSLSGITVQNITAEAARKFGWDVGERGVVITEIIPGTPAKRTKLVPGDLIKEIDGRKIQNLRDYNEASKEAKATEPLSMLIKRGNSTFHLTVEAVEEK
jgi:serine protease Do